MYLTDEFAMKASAHKQYGIGVGYVLGLIGLLSLLGVHIVSLSHIQSASTEAIRYATTVKQEVQLLDAALKLCAIKYPGGLSGGVKYPNLPDTSPANTATCPGAPFGNDLISKDFAGSYFASTSNINNLTIIHDVTGVKARYTVSNGASKEIAKAVKLIQSYWHANDITYASNELTIQLIR